MAHSVADIILAQLGGTKFVIMTGAYSFCASDNTLSFLLPASATKGRGIRMAITLSGSDDYTLKYSKMMRDRVTLQMLDRREGVYCEQLQDTFTDMTGLLTTLAGAA